MANTGCSIKNPLISSAFISKEGNELLSSIKAARYVDYINYLFGNIFQREYLDNDSFVTLSDFTDDSSKMTVSGSLNNLYNKVRNELQNLINSDFVNTIPESTQKELTLILENWKLFVNYHSKYNAYISVSAQEMEEEEAKEEEGSLEKFDKRGNDHTEFSLLTNQVRTLFKFLPKTELVKRDGKIEGVPVINPADGLPVRGDFENIFKLTLDALKGIKDENKFIEVLTSDDLLFKLPELYNLFKILPLKDGGVANLNNKQRLLFHEFFQIMSRDYIPVYGSSIDIKRSDLPVHIRYKAARSNVRKIKQQFVSNFMSSQEENEFLKFENIIDEKRPQNSIFGVKRLIALPAKPVLINLSIDELNSLSIRSIRTKYKAHFDFFKLLGIEFSDFSLLPDKKQLIKVLNHALTLHDNLAARIKRKEVILNPVKDVKDPISYYEESKRITIPSLAKVIKEIVSFEGSISKISPTIVTKGPTGENRSDITYSNAISIAVEQVNSAKSLEDLYTKPYFLKLKYNPLHKNSYVARTIVGNNNISYELENYAGHTENKIDEDITGADNQNLSSESESWDTKDLSDINKFISDFNNLLGWGTINTPQLESKAGYFAIKFFDKTADKPILPFPESMFTKDFITGSDFTAQITHYLHGEIERIKGYDSVKSYAPASYGKFFIFERFAPDELKKDLLLDKNTIEYKKAERQVISNINKHFNDELNNLKSFIQKNNIKNFVSKKILSNFNINPVVFQQNYEEYLDTFLRTFIANDFVHNVEFGIYISGDPLFYKDYHKRLGGLSSTGTQPISTSNLRYYFDSDAEKIFWNTFSLRGILNEFESENKKEAKRDNSSTYLSAVLKENTVKEGTEYQKESTIENYIYSVKLNTGKEITREQAINDLKIDQIATEGINVGDGQGYLNLDAARELSIKQGTYRPQQDVSYKYEALIFKEMLLEDQGKSLNEDDTKLLRKLERQILSNPDKYALPTLKQSYYGTISNPSVEIDAKIFDKFSLAILLPSTAKNHPELKKLLLAMAERQIHYVKYKSGTKGFVRKVFNSLDELSNPKAELDELQSTLLKLQITPPKSEKVSTKIPTQKIKLLFTNLFDGENANPKVKELRDEFIKNLNNIKDYNRKSILTNLGFTTNDAGKIVSWDKEKIVNALVTQVNLQKLPTSLLEAIETDENGNFVNTIESSNIYKQLLNYITGKLDSTLREFKVNGGDFVLISESMFSNPLAYFRLNQDKTAILPCEARITLNKEFAKLLNLPDFEDPTKTIGSIKKMNQLLKNPKFVEKYNKELTITFSRPPVQGPNSMGTAIIVEFFHPTAGNILQLPKEFMHQAGIDFDYDKEKVLIPSLTEEGSFITPAVLQQRSKNIKASDEFKSLIGEAQDAKKLYDYLSLELEDFENEEEYNKAKEAVLSEDNILKMMLAVFGTSKEATEKNMQEIRKEISKMLKVKDAEKSVLFNNLLNSIINSLKQPEIYSELILPNTNETVRPLAIKNGEDINNLNTLPQGVDVYSYLHNLKVFKMFNDAKALLGPFALHNVFIELIAPLDIRMSLDYSFDKDLKPTRKVNRLLIPYNNPASKERVINISKREDINGNNKQHITSEFINATVDSAKDPYFANFMLSFDNINTFTYLITMDYPIETAVDFVSSAVVRRYIYLKNQLPSNTRKDQIAAMILKELTPTGLKAKITMDLILKTDEAGIDKDNSELLLRLKELKSDESYIKDEKLFNLHAKLLCNFIAMEEHSRQYSDFKNLFKNDTNKTSSLYEISFKQNLKKSVISNGMFLKEDIEKVENQSTISATRNDDLISEVLSTVFPLMSVPQVFEGLGKLFNDSKISLSKMDRRILSQIITNDYIANILFTFGTHKNENIFTYGVNLLTKSARPDGTLTKTLLERLHSLRQNKEYPTLVKIFPVLEKIIGVVSERPLKNNRVYKGKYGYNIFLNIDPNIPIIEQESFMSQFKEIIEGNFTTENPTVKSALINLVKDFFIAGIVQSGFNKTGISYLDYAPISFIQSLLNPALKNYQDAANTIPDFYKVFVDYFANNLFKYANPKYFNFRGDKEKSLINSYTHLGKYLYTKITYNSGQTESASNTTGPVTGSTNPKVSSVGTAVYAKLGNVTQSENVVIRSWGELKDATQAITDDGVVSTRIQNTDQHFGNIYSHEFSSSNIIKTNTIREAVEKYVDWVVNSNDKRAQWIREQLKSGKLKGKPIYYYKELGEPSHATALDFLINKYNWNPNTETRKTINIWAGTNENAELSNMAKRPFKYNFGGGEIDFDSVEQAYQYAKGIYAEVTAYNSNISEKILNSTNSFDIKQLGNKYEKLDKETWDKNSSRIMKNLITASFEQNPEAKKKLLDTENAILTHTQDKGKWGMEFPRILMEVRDLFKNETKRPEEKSSKFLRTKNIITRDMVIGTPNILYIFGDNVMRAGLGGQAKEMRGEPNAYGIATKIAPSSEERAFFTDDMLDYNKEIILKDIQNIKDAWNTGKYTNIILPPIGEGLADLKNKAPKTWEFLQEELNKLENFVIKDPASTIKGETIDNEFKYYGATYSIKVVDGVATDVLNLKKGDSETNAKFNERKNKILDAYNTNPNVDVQNGKQFRGDKSTFANPNVENEKPINIIPENKYTFEYKGKSISTEFELGEQQSEALKALINFVEDRDSRFITLQGAAGTGKTTIIGYLQKYVSRNASFAYLAPTHAATAELAFATVKTGNDLLPATLASAITTSPITKKSVFTQKITSRLGYNPVIILDESSMIDQSDVDKLNQALEDLGGKLIFLGDEKQISKVDSSNKQVKKVSPAFSNFNQIMLTKIYRQSDNSLLALLSKMREQNDFKLFKVENSGAVKFVNKADFSRELREDIIKNPETTVVITYTNNAVQGINKVVRQILGRTGQTVVGDIVVGYLGYASKQIEKKNIANSIQYKITDIKKTGSVMNITAESKKLQKLIDSGIGGISPVATTKYHQLSKDDALTFDELDEKDYAENNMILANKFAKLHKATLAYGNKEINYQTYLRIIADFSMDIAEYSVGADYVYNPLTNKMEKYDINRHKSIKTNGQGSLLFNKDIDYGHAITIHKSQGSTIDNVYFDSSSLASAKNVPIVDEQGRQVTTEKMSLAYVGMSRSKVKLVVYEGDNKFEFLGNQNNNVPLQDNPDLNDIGFTKNCE